MKGQKIFNFLPEKYNSFNSTLHSLVIQLQIIIENLLLNFNYYFN